MLRCSAESAARSNDPAGSATTFERYLLIPHSGPWTASAAEDAVAQHLSAESAAVVSAEKTLRPFAIRPVDDRRSTTMYYVVGTVGSAGGYRGARTRPTADELKNTPTGTADTRPFLAVCTNGKRDRCCAIDGRALALDVLREFGPENVTEISHLGGHRFAPTAMLFPWGYSYAFLTPQAATTTLRLAHDGLIAPDLLRGRADLSEPAQAAEIHWRRQLGPASPGAVSDIAVHTQDDGAATVTATVAGSTESVTVRYENAGTVTETLCGGKPFEVGRWVVE